MLATLLTHLTAITISRLSQYTSSLGIMAYCYAEPTVSLLAMAMTTASTHCACPQNDGQAESTWVAG